MKLGVGGGLTPFMRPMISLTSLMRSFAYSGFIQDVMVFFTSFWSLFKDPLNAPASI